MKVGSSSVSVVGGTINEKNRNLTLILGITIPGVVLILLAIGTIIYCKKRKESRLRDLMVKQQADIYKDSL